MPSVYFQGDFAHFSNPLLKAEGTTFPGPPPSALRGAIENILFKMGVYVDVRRITYHRPIRTMNFKTNGLKHAVGMSQITLPDAHQMNNTLLYDVAYTVDFDLRLCWRDRETQEIVKFDERVLESQDLRKYMAMYEKYIRLGKCQHPPWLGSKFCEALFRAPRPEDTPIQESRDLGMMTHGIEYRKAGNITHVFHPVMRDGVVEVDSFFDVLKARYGLRAGQ